CAAFLVLWSAAVWLFTPDLSLRAVEQAGAHAVLAPKVVTARIEQRRAELQRALLRVIANPSASKILESLRGREAPSADSLKEVRAFLSEALPAEMRAALVVGLVNGAGAVVTRGIAPVPPDALDISTLSEAGGSGILRDAFGQPHLFHSASISSNHLIVGAPLLSDAAMEAIIKEDGLAALALVRGGKVIQAAGPGMASAEKASALAISTRAEVVERGQVGRFGPFKLPFLTSGDLLGGSAPIAVASHQALASTPYEVVTVVSVAAMMEAIGAPQKFAVMGFLLLAGLGAVALALIGGARQPKRKVESAEEPVSTSAPEEEPAPVELSRKRKKSKKVRDAEPEPAQIAKKNEAETTARIAPQRDESPAPEAPAVVAEPSSTPFVASGDFQQLASSSSEPLPPAEEPAPASSADEEPPASARNGVPSSPPPLPAAAAAGSNGNGVPAFAEALFGSLHTSSGALEDPADAKTIAAPPPETTPARGNPVPNGVPAAEASESTSEEAHFQDVFKNFLAMRQQCGEPADGLTYEKFAQKLQKNREQLINRYNCRTVRFQVYVKEGKAALKATPVKE
ncbi:MAG TPA: MXAN_5187 family protein, partial [Myxococcaceae bacterium]|nr:MXAN_5187 family protein [Myxococcaceae bacterium]